MNRKNRSAIKLAFLKGAYLDKSEGVYLDSVIVKKQINQINDELYENYKIRLLKEIQKNLEEIMNSEI